MVKGQKKEKNGMKRTIERDRETRLNLFNKEEMKEIMKRVFSKAKQLRITLNAWENLCTYRKQENM
jgi:hypothetical protein